MACALCNQRFEEMVIKCICNKCGANFVTDYTSKVVCRRCMCSDIRIRKFREWTNNEVVMLTLYLKQATNSELRCVNYKAMSGELRRPISAIKKKIERLKKEGMLEREGIAL